MTREEWIKLFNQIPESIHDHVVLSLSTGIDVYVQRFLQMAELHILARGRLGGTDEGERIFLIPWPELKMIFFSRPVGDEVLFQVFGDLIGGVRKALAVKRRDEEDEEEEQDDEDEGRPEPVRLPAPAPAAQDTSKPAGINLDELKSRLLQPRKLPPKTETNKPGTGVKPPGRDTQKKV